MLCPLVMPPAVPAALAPFTPPPGAALASHRVCLSRSTDHCSTLSAAETQQAFCAFPHSNGREACLQPYSAKSQRLHSVVPGNMENWRLEPAGLHIVLRRTLGIGPDAGAAEQPETSSIDPQAPGF